jgi:ABC-type phosphate transport system substrate-binding protein
MRFTTVSMVICTICVLSFAQDKPLTRKEIGRLEAEGKISREESIRLVKEIMDREWQEQKRLMDEARARNEEARQEIRSQSLCLAGTDTALGMLESLYPEFRKNREDVPRYLEYQGGGDDIGIRDLVKGHAEAALIRNPLTKEQIAQLAKAFPGHDFQKSKIHMGSLALVLK